ncbi:formate dehydrogenase accessory protein FdhE, partial [Yersinia pestis PY-08]|jgi:hypothetical protein
MSIR